MPNKYPFETVHGDTSDADVAQLIADVTRTVRRLGSYTRVSWGDQDRVPARCRHRRKRRGLNERGTCAVPLALEPPAGKTQRTRH